jgi:hypothetical protein
MNAINSMIGNQPLPLALQLTAEDTTMKMNNRKIISDWCKSLRDWESATWFKLTLKKENERNKYENRNATSD